MVKNQAKAKQHPETGLFLNFENYSLSSALCNPKIVEDILKNMQKTSVSVLMR